ncbi:MAG TPA: TetR/AcrR family transcriptional regulator [Polyangiaceae bacterium]|jgi:TetR/AcrR family transcriptional repressor of bet genes|nr:TetR/AcrR family transcriptional regulator [Polyangiaceae bacterium]
MGRPSKRAERRREILEAFARVLADHGYAGATVARVAAEAGVAPGLVHHHFENKAELLSGLLQDLVARFRQRVRRYEGGAPRDDTGAGSGDGDRLLAYVDGALKLDEHADQSAARCWVGVFAEAVRDPALFAQMRRLIDTEIAALVERSAGKFSAQDAGCVLAFIIGSLVVGAFAPRKTAGFAAPGLRRLVEALQASG